MKMTLENPWLDELDRLRREVEHFKKQAGEQRKLKLEAQAPIVQLERPVDRRESALVEANV